MSHLLKLYLDVLLASASDAIIIGFQDSKINRVDEIIKSKEEEITTI